MDYKLFGIKELAEFLGVKPSWCYSKSREKGPESIPRIYVGKYVKFKIDDVMEWLKKKNESA